MRDDTLYLYSKDLGCTLDKIINGAKNWHYYRYRYLVDSSKSKDKYKCKYAIATKVLGEGEDAALVTWLRGIREEMDNLIDRLERDIDERGNKDG